MKEIFTSSKSTRLPKESETLLTEIILKNLEDTFGQGLDERGAKLRFFSGVSEGIKLKKLQACKLQASSFSLYV